MVRFSGDVTDPRVARTRRDVIDATAAMLRDAGWGAVTHAEVAKRSGYSKATLYAHWPTPMDLMREAITHICGETRYPPATGDLHADLHTALRGLVQSLESGSYAQIMAGAIEHSGQDAGARELRDRLYESATGGVRRILATHIPSDEIAPVLSMLVGAALVRVTYEGATVTDTFLNDIIRSVLPSKLNAAADS